jgi:hypothetical protein
VSRHARKTDANHATIRDGLRNAGFHVIDLSGAGGGVPDLMVEILPGLSYFLEIKDGAKPKSAQALTAAQEEWRKMAWQMTGKATTIKEAIDVLTIAKMRFGALDFRPMAER